METIGIEALKINKDLIERSHILSVQQKEANQCLEDTLKQKEHAFKQLKGAQTLLIDNLIELRKKAFSKIHFINEAHDFYSEELERLKKTRNYEPSKRINPSQEQLNEIHIEMSNLLKFDSISVKKAKMQADFQAKCIRIKDEIKKVKLKISLTELQINEAQKKSAKKSVKF